VRRHRRRPRPRPGNARKGEREVWFGRARHAVCVGASTSATKLDPGAVADGPRDRPSNSNATTRDPARAGARDRPMDFATS